MITAVRRDFLFKKEICTIHRWTDCTERRPESALQKFHNQIILHRRENTHSDQPPFFRGPLRKKNLKKNLLKVEVQRMVGGRHSPQSHRVRKDKCEREM